VAHGTGRSRARAPAFFAVVPADWHGVYLPSSASVVHRAAGPEPILEHGVRLRRPLLCCLQCWAGVVVGVGMDVGT
jgi:hypothetical protein